MHAPTAVLSMLHVGYNMFIYSHSPKTSLRAGGTHLAVLARSVMAYLNVSLESGDLDKVSKSLTMQTTRALMAIFK